MDKKVFPANVPLLFWLGFAPKIKEDEWEGKPTTNLLFTFKCVDNRHPELVDAPFWVKVGTWISYRDANKETKLLKLLRGLTGDSIPDSVYGTDAKDWSKDEWRPFFGYYGVTFGKPNEKGWQDALAMLPASAFGLDVAKLKAELPKWEGKKEAPAPAPSENPVLEYPANLVNALIGYWNFGNAYKEMLKTLAGKTKFADMGSETLKHLYTLCILQDMLVNGQAQAALVTSLLKGRALHTITPAEAIGMWVAAQEPFEEEAPF